LNIDDEVYFGIDGEVGICELFGFKAGDFGINDKLVLFGFKAGEVGIKDVDDFKAGDFGINDVFGFFIDGAGRNDVLAFKFGEVGINDVFVVVLILCIFGDVEYKLLVLFDGL